MIYENDSSAQVHWRHPWSPARPARAGALRRAGCLKTNHKSEGNNDEINVAGRFGLVEGNRWTAGGDFPSGTSSGVGA